jgi:hypothetical protein
MHSNEILYSNIEDHTGVQSLCIFASFDKESQVQKYVYHLLNKLVDELDSHVVFVTTSDRLEEKDKTALSKLGISVIHRKNTGYDFKSYCVGLEAFKTVINSFRKIFHTNDSVYGPFGSMREIREKMDSSGFDVWGMTDSWQINYHLQSYFVAFDAVVFDALIEFWEQYSFKEDYTSVVNNGEVGMSQFMIKKGYCLGAAFPVEQHIAPYLTKVENACNNAHSCMKSMSKPRWYSISRRAMTVNPSFALWKPLIKSGYPFLKKKLLLEWCHLGSHSGDWLNIVSDNFYYAKTVAQASAHRDRPSLGGVSRPKKSRLIQHPHRYRKYSKNWAEFMRSLVTD